jgi:hypothetical protein
MIRRFVWVVAFACSSSPRPVPAPARPPAALAAKPAPLPFDPSRLPRPSTPVDPPRPPQPPRPVDPLDLPATLDPAIRTGKLANGLTYYVLKHRKPEHRAALWLAVDAGSVLEDDDQRGLAHFVEHMAINGTRRFPSSTSRMFDPKHYILVVLSPGAASPRP